MPKRKRQQTTATSSATTCLFGNGHILAIVMLWQILYNIGTVNGKQQKDTEEQVLNRIPPSIYKWIEENAHICTIVPANGENLVNFLSVADGAKCALCPELGPREVPAMACAIEVSPNDIGVDIGCHPVPELCVLELKTRYAEFYSGAPLGGLPPGPPGPPGKTVEPQRTRSEEEIFEAAGNLFSSASSAGNSNLVPEITVEKEEIDEIVDEDERNEKQRSKEVFEIKGRLATKATTASSTTTIPSTTMIPANMFVRPRPKVLPLNLTMEEMHMSPRTAKPFPGPVGPPTTKRPTGQGRNGGEEEEEVPLTVKSPANSDPMFVKKRVKGPEGGGKGEEQDEEQQSAATDAPCRDRHALCCFWAMSGECDSNPFWMRTKCPMTCGTCGCKVRNADKCHSVGVKCVLPTSTTTTPSTAATTTTPSRTTTPSTLSSPPTSTRRRPRPTPPSKPGHRPQRPKTRTRISATSTTIATPAIPEEQETEEPPPFDQSNLVTVVVEGFGEGEDHHNTLVSGHSGKNAEARRGSGKNAEPEDHRIDSVSESGRRPWSLNALGPGYETDAEPAQIETRVTTSEPLTTTVTTTQETCFNYHKLCEFWAKMGECTNNPFWMRPHCQIACGSCGETLGDISTPPPRPGGCNNDHILCPFWAFIGECARNPRWMGLNCMASCRLC